MVIKFTERQILDSVSIKKICISHIVLIGAFPKRLVIKFEHVIYLRLQNMPSIYRLSTPWLRKLKSLLPSALAGRGNTKIKTINMLSSQAEIWNSAYRWGQKQIKMDFSTKWKLDYIREMLAFIQCRNLPHSRLTARNINAWVLRTATFRICLGKLIFSLTLSEVDEPRTHKTRMYWKTFRPNSEEVDEGWRILHERNFVIRNLQLIHPKSFTNSENFSVIWNWKIYFSLLQTYARFVYIFYAFM